MFKVLNAVVLALLGAPALCETYPGVVRFPVSRSKSDQLLRRDTGSQGVLNENIENRGIFYSIQCELGTPPQFLKLLIDTGSSDFWMMSSETPLCQEGKCLEDSQFDSSNSSTFKANGTTFQLSYADNTGATGTWAQDVLTLGGTDIKNFNFALANVSTSNHAIAGIGLAKGESPYIYGFSDTPYANLPMQLKANGLISHVAYSLYLDAKSDSEGSLIFGGINTGAYNGIIYTHPMVPVEEKYIDRLAINLQGIYLMGNNGNQEEFAYLALPVTFDSGTTYTTLPAFLVTPLMEAMGATYWAEYSQYLVECNQLYDNPGGLGLVFSDVEYVINFRDILIEVGDGLCQIGIFPGDVAYIGDNMLRSLYVVYDLENLEIGIAQANTASSISTSYQAISGSIPGQKAPGYSKTHIPGAPVPTSVQVGVTVGGVASYNQKDVVRDISSKSFSSGSGSGSASQSSSSSASATSSNSSGKSSNAAPAPNMVFAGGIILGFFNLIMLLI